MSWWAQEQQLRGKEREEEAQRQAGLARQERELREAQQREFEKQYEAQLRARQREAERQQHEAEKQREAQQREVQQLETQKREAAKHQLEAQQRELEEQRAQQLERQREDQQHEVDKLQRQLETQQYEALQQEAERQRDVQLREAQQREARQREAQQREAQQREAQQLEAQQLEAQQRERPPPMLSVVTEFPIVSAAFFKEEMVEQLIRALTDNHHVKQGSSIGVNDSIELFKRMLPFFPFSYNYSLNLFLNNSYIFFLPAFRRIDFRWYKRNKWLKYTNTVSVPEKFLYHVQLFGSDQCTYQCRSWMFWLCFMFWFMVCLLYLRLTAILDKQTMETLLASLLGSLGMPLHPLPLLVLHPPLRYHLHSLIILSLLCYVLCYVMLCYVMLCYVMLSYVMFDINYILKMRLEAYGKSRSSVSICWYIWAMGLGTELPDFQMWRYSQ